MSEQAPIIAPTAPIAASEPKKRVVSVLKRVLGSVVVTMGTKLGLAAVRKAIANATPIEGSMQAKLAENSDLLAIGGGTLLAVAVKNEWAEAVGIGVAAGGAIEAIEKRVMPKLSPGSTADPGTTGETSAQPGETEADPFG